MNDRRPISSVFVAEALVLFFFVAAAIAVTIGVALAAASTGKKADDLAHAIDAAQTIAEEFSANPKAVNDITQIEGLTVVCDKHSELGNSGELCNAVIKVYMSEMQPGSSPAIYELDVSKYITNESISDE